MKVFVSGQINDLDYVRHVQETFMAAGHMITHDWTRNETGDKLLGGRQAKFDNPNESARRADLDMRGVVDSDVYVICTSNAEVGKGMYVELGAALALNMATGSPKIYLIGDMSHASIFYFHHSITNKNSVTDIIDEINKGIKT